MNGFISSIESAVAAEIWQPALALSLSLPDILGQIEYPELSGRGKTGARYAKWFDTWVAPALYIGEWTQHAGKLTGQDCYAFRCTYLHVGESLLDKPHKSQWRRILPTPRDLGHFTTVQILGVKAVLLVGVTPLCKAICDASRSWGADLLNRRPEAQVKLDQLLFINTGVASFSDFLEVDGLDFSAQLTLT